MAKETDGRIEKMIKRLSEARDNIEEMTTKMKTQENEANKQIDRHYDELGEKLMKQRSQVKQKVQSTVSQEMKALGAKCDKVKLAQVELEGLKMKHDSLAMASDDDESYAKQKQLISKWFLKLESAHEKDLQPVEMDKIEFFPSTSDFPDFCHLSVCPSLATFDYEVMLPEYIYINKKLKLCYF